MIDEPSPAAEVRQRYATRVVEVERRLAELDRRDADVGRARGFAFLALAAVGLVGLVRRLPELGVLFALIAVVFVALVIRHARIATLQFEEARRLELVRRGLARTDGSYRAPASEPSRRGLEHRPADHPYALDLDLFGERSLFELLDTTQTPLGSKRLAEFLLSAAPADVVSERQAAARELAGKEAFREALALLGMRAKSALATHDPRVALDWAKGRGEPLPVPFAFAIVAGTVALGVLSSLGLAWAARPFGAFVLAQIGLGVWLRGRVEPILGPIATKHSPLGGYPAVLELCEREAFESATLVRLQLRMRAGGGAAAALANLDRLLGFAAVRHNALIQVVANVFLSWDVFAAARLEAWRRRHGEDVERWLEALAEVEALSALGTFAAEHPDFAWPSVDSGATRFVARGLGHPLVPPRVRVANDVALEDVRSLMITGSNMSGKSTMLRSMGVAAVLAQAGAPVCAEALALSELRVFTSMRIDDSLAAGASHFFAEVRRLKAVVDAAREPTTPVLFLLDEVLHGTNSRERILGAKAVVQHLVERGAIGAVSSHDLGLVALEAETEGQVRNVHFQEHVADGAMGFDYQMRPGPVATSNALRLMRQVGIDVVPCDDDVGNA